MARSRPPAALTWAADESQQLAAILRSVAEAIVATDPAGAITMLNPAAERLFAVRQSAALGQPLHTLHENLGRWLARAQAETPPAPLVFSLELQSGRFFSATLASVQAEPGQAAGWVIVLQDQSQLKQAEEWKTEAIQSATHDLRNPINLMNGALNLLRDTLPALTAEQQECLTMLRSGLDRMSGLVEQVLNLDQAAGRAQFTLVGADLRALAQQATEEFRLTAAEKALTLTFTAPAETGRVWGDDSWLLRAIANLLSNAVKYTPAGGRVEVHYSEADGQAICEVSDTGPGIPATSQGRLFERFYRAPGEVTRRNPGTGLGLAIVKTIVERHSGRVWASSEEGLGSTFGFAVPLITTASDQPPTAAA